MSLLALVRGLRPKLSEDDAYGDSSVSSHAADNLPNPADPPGARGEWERAALTNVQITELVKRQIGCVTRPWNK